MDKKQQQQQQPLKEGQNVPAGVGRCSAVCIGMQYDD
jgi:hypothetical protein